jgi:aspartate aminotransferase
MIRSKVKPSLTLALLAKVRELRAQGKEIFSFAAGEPDFDTPKIVVDEAARSMRAGNTRYVATPGQNNLRQAVAKDYQNRLGAKWVKAENVIATAGAKEGIYLTLAALLEKGDQVVIPKPYWVSYPDVVKAAGGTCVFMDTLEKDGYFPTVSQLEGVYSDRTKALIFASPSNPTGTMIRQELLQEVVDWCVKRKVVLIYDELYERLILDQTPHICPLALIPEEHSDYVVSVNACSKTLAMTGWRLGYLVTSKENVSGLSPLQGQMLTCLPGFIQDAAVVGLEKVDSFLPEYIELFKARLEIMMEGLGKIPHVKAIRPSGAFYIFADVSEVMKTKNISSDYTFCEQLLEEKSVALVAGSSMGMPGWVRFSFACSAEEIRGGLDAFGKFCKINS